MKNNYFLKIFWKIQFLEKNLIQKLMKLLELALLQKKREFFF
jgi:hypothetical protein